LRFVALCLSLGRRHGAVQVVRADDTPRDLVVTGRAGALGKETVVRGTVWDIRRTGRKRAARTAESSSPTKEFDAAGER